MGTRARWAAFAAGALTAMLVVACGDSSPARPTLAVTPQPTATAAICEPTAAIPLPQNFPEDFPVPKGYVVFRSSTTPTMEVVGRVPVPEGGNQTAPHGAVAYAIVQEMQKEGWAPQLNQLVDGADYDMTAADGRVLHFNAVPVPACNQVQLTIDARWITG